MLLGCLKAVMPTLTLLSSSDVDEAFFKRMRDQGGAFLYPGVISIRWDHNDYNRKKLNDFLDLIKSSPLLEDVIISIPRSKILESHPFKSCDAEVGKIVFAHQVFEALLEVGLQLNASDYIIVDPENEPAVNQQQHLD